MVIVVYRFNLSGVEVVRVGVDDRLTLDQDGLRLNFLCNTDH